MARINFDTFNNEMQKQETSSVNGDGVGYFGLKNDGDEGVVRILHNSPEDFDIVIAHNLKIGERYRKVNCLCNPGEDSSVCPLCASGNKPQYRFFVHMIQYTKDEKGAIVAKPVIWDRSAKQMSQKLVSMIHEYGPLSDSVFKIRRNGAAGSMETTYEIMFANPNIYKPELYPMIPDAFANYNTLGVKVLNKSAEDMAAFLATGNFPNPNPNAAQSATNAAPAYNAPPAPPVQNVGYSAPVNNNAPAAYTQPANTGYAQSATGYPTTSAATQRPNRYY